MNCDEKTHLIAERQNDMGRYGSSRHNDNIQTAPKSPRKGSKSSKHSRTHSERPKDKRDIRQGGNSVRIIQERKNRRSCCSNPETQKGIGAVIFTLGIPSFIAGLIMTIVSATDDDHENKYPKSFIVAGPIVLVLSIILFITGIFLHSTFVREAFLDCFSLDNPDSFCRVQCPTLSQCISPDEMVAINQSGTRALQSEPGKPVLKRSRNPLLSEPSASCSSALDNNDNITVTSEENNDVFYEENSNNVNDQNGRANRSRVRTNPRGVRFSDGDVYDLKRNRTSSVTSDNGSLLSLKHCKIHPKNDDIWWTDETQPKMNTMNSAKAKVNTSPLETTEL